LSLAVAGCDTPRQDGETREWEASDHVAPPTTPSEGQSAGGDAEPPSPEVIERAVAALFLQRCASCHGASGAGDGAAAPVSDMPDFTAAAYQDAKTDADLSRAIRMGAGLMPAFGDQLNERGIAALVGHIRRLRAAE